MKIQPIKLISALPIDDYDMYDSTIILPPGVQILARQNEKLYMIIGDGHTQLSSLHLYALKTEEELNNITTTENIIFTNELVTSIPINVNDFDTNDNETSTSIKEEDLVIGNIVSALEFELLYQ